MPAGGRAARWDKKMDFLRFRALFFTYPDYICRITAINPSAGNEKQNY
jgi:hypothetical protein